MTNRVPALIAAQAVAMTARTNRLDALAVEDMRRRAEEVLDRDDPMRAAILSFATRYPGLRHDPVALGYLGRELEQALLVDLNPGRASQRRSDIDD